MVTDTQFREAWAGTADCAHCPTRDLSLFAHVRSEDLLPQSCSVNHYKLDRGITVYRSGERGHDLFCLRAGMLKLERFLPDGSRRIVRLVKPNDIFGLEVLLKPEYRHDAVVLQDAMLCRISAELVHDLAERNPVLHRDIMDRWQAALNEADDWLTELVSGHARQRVARLLVRLCDHNKHCSLLSREDMGALLSVTTETASRAVAEFKRAGLLEEIGQNRYRCDTQGLEAISAG
ncbi:Crp/Fnr family transcriptional regulator [Granulosicoccaceae sp. 1_MG-2023]|nr:Crp/Fnr family transcriptional regulator [Granulosicoccaceae sp. 1_MG-2023]